MCLKQNIGHEQEAKLPARHVMPPFDSSIAVWGATLRISLRFNKTKIGLEKKTYWKRLYLGYRKTVSWNYCFLDCIYIYISQSIFPIPLQCNRLASQEASKLQEMVIQKDRSQSWPWKPWKLGNPGNSMGKTSWWMDGENILASYSAVYAGVRVSPSLCG